MQNISAKYFRAIPLLVVFSGLFLSALLPIGLFDKPGSQVYLLLHAAHLFLLLAAAATAVLFFVKISRLSKWPAYLPILILVLFSITVILLSFLPFTDHNALALHLYLPKYWLQAGKIIEIKWHAASYYPLLLELGFSGFLHYGLDLLTPLYHFCFLLVLCGMIAAFLFDQLQDAEAAVSAFILTLTLPICQSLASSPRTELGLAVFAAAAAVFAVSWANNKRGLTSLLLCSAALSLCIATATNGFLFLVVFIIGLAVLGFNSGKSIGAVLWSVVVCGFTITLLSSPWILRNMLWTSNPFHPLLSGFVGTSHVSLRFKPYQSPEFFQVIEMFRSNWQDILLMPLDSISGIKKSSLLSFDGALSPLLFMAVFPLFFRERKNWFAFFAVVALLYFLSSLFFTLPRVSYYLPLAAAALICSAYGLYLIASRFTEKKRIQLYSSCLAIHLLFSLMHIFILADSKQLSEFYFGGWSKSDYLVNVIPEYPAIDWVNNQLPEDSQLTMLLLLSDSFYYYQKNIASEGEGSTELLNSLVQQSKGAKILATGLRSLGVTYVMLNAEKLDSEFYQKLSKRKQKLWSNFVKKYLKIEHQQDNFLIAAVSSVGGKDQKALVSRAE